MRATNSTCLTWLAALVLGCGGGTSLLGDEDATDDATAEDVSVDEHATDVAEDDGPRDAPPDIPAGCPAEWPDPGSACTSEGLRCEYGSETCCGETHPSFVCQCGGGTFGCYYTDACMGAPFGCTCTTDEDCDPGYGRAWCEGGTCVPCDDSGRTCGIYCPGGFVPERNGCQPCACAECPTVGEGYCTCDAGCGEPGRICEAGLGQCVEDSCAVIDCAPGYFCDALRGCVAAECATAADCRLIYSTCGCQAVPTSDPRTTLDPCTYEGGVVCAYNVCEGDGVLATCRGGLCTEAYSPGCGG